MCSMANPLGKHGPQRRRHGEGSRPLAQRDHKRLARYRCTLSLGVDPETHQRVRKYFYGATPALAEAKRDDAIRQLQRIAPAALGMTVAQLLERHLSSIEPPVVRATTFDRYEGIARNHLIPALGHVALADLDVAIIRRAVPSWGRSTRSQAYALERLRAALAFAVQERWVDRNEASYVKPPAVVSREAPTITPADACAILAAFRGHRLYALVVLALASGLRRGEAMGLSWADVDLRAATLTVRWSLRHIPHEWRTAQEKAIEQTTRLVPPKSAKSHRILPLPRVARVALRWQRMCQRTDRRRTRVWSENGLVFVDREGRTLNPRLVTRQVEAVLREIVPGMRLHDLRAGYATILAAEQVHPRVAQGLLGHTTIQQSMDYTKVVPAAARASARRVDRALKIAGSGAR